MKRLTEQELKIISDNLTKTLQNTKIVVVDNVSK